MKKKVLLTIICFLGIYSVSTALKPAGTILYPSDNETNVSIQPTIQIADSNWATEVEYLISKDSSFNDTTLHRTIFYDTTYSLNALALGLSFKEDYYIKMRLSDSTQLSEWSSTIKFSTVNSPTITFPVDSTTTHVASDLTWKSNVYDMEVQFWKDSLNADTLVFFIKGDEFTYNFEEEIFFSDLPLGYNESYFVRVRQNDSTYGLSDWSDITYFSTEQPPQLLSPQPNSITIQSIDYLEDNELTDMTVTRDVTNNDFVGSINGTLNVSPSGAAEYNIEIWSPQGTNGIKPNISLKYNSQLGQGLAGWGWNISGLSAITRTRKNRYLDGVDEGLSLGVDDLLSLDGTRLILTDEGDHQNYGIEGAVYTTRNGDNLRIEHVNGNTGDLNSYFIAKDKQGNVSYYGEKPESKSKLSPPDDLNTDHVVSWRLNKVKDIHGNYIEYIYDDSYEGMNLIKEIKYTGFETDEGINVSLPYASIEFEYAQKAQGSQYLDEVNDQNEYYGNELLQKNSLIIKNIIIKYDDVEVKKYSLEYIFNRVTYLHRIKEFGVGDPNLIEREVKNETAFDYYFDESRLISKKLDQVPSFIDDDEYSTHFGDFNGDGIQDRLLIDRNEVTPSGNNRAVGYLQYGSYFKCLENGTSNSDYKCTGDVIYTPAVSKDQNRDPGFCFDVMDYVYRGGRLYSENIVIADINNDGKDDLILPFLSIQNDYLAENGFGPLQSFKYLNFDIYKGTEHQLDWVTNYLQVENNRGSSSFVPISGKKVHEHFLPADYTGDGFIELVYQTEFHLGNNIHDQNLFFIDLIDDNGNFKNEGNVVNNSYFQKKLLRTYSLLGPQRDLGSNSQVYADFYTVEMISNGKTELLFSQKGNSDDEGVYTIEFNSSGNPFLKKEYTLNNSDPNFDLRNVLFISDFNGDGLSDILYRDDEEKADNKKWFVSYWKGNDFTERKIVEELITASPRNLLLGDFNGDGMIDIYNYDLKATHYSPAWDDPYYRKLKITGNIFYSKGVTGFIKDEVFNYEFEKNFDNEIIFESGENPGTEFIQFPNNIDRLAYSPPVYGNDKYTNETIGDNMLLDLNGDGNSDLYSPHFHSDYPALHQENDAILMFNPSQHNKHLKIISDGYGNRTEIHYEPISNGSVDDNNEEVFRKELTPIPSDILRPLNAGMWVVNKVDKYKSKNTDVNQSVSYTYGKSVFHKELGFLGFREFFSKSFDDLNSSNYTENKQYYTTIDLNNNNFFSLIPERTVMLRNGNKISETTFNKEIHRFDDGNFLIYDQTTTTKDYLTESMNTINYTYYPSNNNVWTEESIISPLDENNQITRVIKRNTKELTYIPLGVERDGIPIDNKIEKVTSTSEYFNYDENGPVDLSNNPIHTTVTKYEYKGEEDNYLLNKKIDFSGEDKKVENIYNYDIYGNLTTTTIHQTDDALLEDRTVTYSMDDKGRFATDYTNGIGTSSRVYDEVFGNIKKAFDIQGNNLDYEYDSFGLLKQKKDVYDNVVETKREWYIHDPNSNVDSDVLFTVKELSTTAPDLIKYYDGYGNLLRQELEAIKTKNNIDYIVKNYVYFPDKRLKRIYKPYFISDVPSNEFVEYQYDSYLREERKIDLGRESITQYNYNSTSRLTRLLAPDGKSKEILTDEAGQTKLTRDNEGFEVEFLYKHDLRSNITKTIALNSKVTIVENDFDVYGNKIRTKDDDAGEYTYIYNAFNELKEQEGPNGLETYKYDKYGRVKEKNNSEGTVGVMYYPSGNGIGRVSTITGPIPGDVKSYTYDSYGRIETETVQIQGEIFNFSYSYYESGPFKGLLKEKTYPSEVKIQYVYNSLSDLIEIYQVKDLTSELLWSIEEQNSYGKITKHIQGPNKVFNHTIFNQYNLPDRVKASSNGWNGPWNLQEWDYDLDHENGNVLKRRDKLTSQIEYFEYDELDRIETIRDKDLNIVLSMDYQNDGSIQSKSDVGDYVYTTNTNGEPEFPIHAVKELENSPRELQGHRIVSTSFNSVKTIESDCNFYAELFYNSSENRNRMNVYYKGVNSIPGDLEYTKFYLDGFEMKLFPNGDKKEVVFVNSPVGIIATIVKHTDGANNSSNNELYYIQSDILGSVERLIDDNGQPVTNGWFSYNIWGELRDPNKWTSKVDNVTLEEFKLLERGYTGHEHLVEFSLINMNGRVYDPIIGQFIQPDNHIAYTNESQSYNRFSYVLNNPLKYTDPSGEWIQYAFMAVVSAAQATTAYNWGGSSAMWRSIGLSVGGFALSAATGALSDQLFKGLGMTIKNSGLLTKSASIYSGVLSSVSSSAILAGISGSKFSLTSFLSSAAFGGLRGAANFEQSLLKDANKKYQAMLDLNEGPLLASNGDVYVPTADNLPEWDNLLKEYMGVGYYSKDVYAKAGGPIYEEYLKDPSYWANSCVLRVDIALRENGWDTKSNGAYGARYKVGYNVLSYINKMNNFFRNDQGKVPNLIPITYDPSKPEDLNKLIGKRGIIAFDFTKDQVWNNANGHFTLFDGTNMDANDFKKANGLIYPGNGNSFTPYWDILRKGHKIYFWELE